MRSRVLNYLIFVLIFVLFISINYIFDKKNNNFSVHFLDVGQGDSIYVREKNIDIIIDAGPGDNVLTELGKYMPFYDRKIEYIILSHPHEDHVGGMVEILRRYEVGEIILTDKTHTSSEYIEFLNLIKEKNIKTTLANNIDNIKINEKINVDFFWPKNSTDNLSLNDSSIVCKLNYFNLSIMFTGDAENTVLNNIASKYTNALQSEILKIPHHGSKTSNTSKFIEYVNPEFAIISAGKKNRFNHPSQETLEVLDKYKIKILGTYEFGTISFVSDGLNFWTK